MNAIPDQYGVVGHPVSHSWSPFIHGLFARETEQSMTYRLFDIPPEQFTTRVREFFDQGGRGLNVTMPHKLRAAEFASELTTRAKQAGAVNTLTREPDGRIVGDNTDGVGLRRDLCDNLGVPITRKRILIIGAGGAARGVLAPLLALEPSDIVIVNRTAERARELAAEFESLGSVYGCGFNELTGSAFDLIVNATSASLSGEMPPLAPVVVGLSTVCYDIAYGKTDTPFMQWGNAHGCVRAVAGWGMLVEQAAESFCIWRGVRPRTEPVLVALKERALSA